MLPVPATLSSSEIEVLVPKRGSLLPEDLAKILLDYKLWLLLGPLVLHITRDQQARRVTILARLIGVDQQESIRAALDKERTTCRIQMICLGPSWYSLAQL